MDFDDMQFFFYDPSTGSWVPVDGRAEIDRDSLTQDDDEVLKAAGVDGDVGRTSSITGMFSDEDADKLMRSLYYPYMPGTLFSCN